MAEVTFISADGASSTTVPASVGMSVMKSAQVNGVSGVYAECGGQLACATCHVYLCDDAPEAMYEISEDEDEMLEATAADRLASSRLSCQIPITDDADAITVRLPEFQR